MDTYNVSGQSKEKEKKEAKQSSFPREEMTARKAHPRRINPLPGSHNPRLRRDQDPKLERALFNPQRGKHDLGGNYQGRGQ